MTPFIPGGRLTLDPARAVMRDPVTGTDKLYYAAWVNAFIPTFDGTDWGAEKFAEPIEMTLTSLEPDALYDVFLRKNGSVLEGMLGPAWLGPHGRDQSSGGGGSSGAAFTGPDLHQNSGSGFSNVNLRQLIEAAHLSGAGDRIRLFLRAPTTGQTAISGMTVGPHKSGGNGWDIDGAPVPVTVGGQSSFVLTADVWTDWIEMPFNSASGLVVAIHIQTGGSTVRRNLSAGAGFNWQVKAGASEINVAEPTGYNGNPGELGIVQAIQYEDDGQQGGGSAAPELIRMDGVFMNGNDLGFGVGRAIYVGTIGANAQGLLDMMVGSHVAAGGADCRLMVWNMYNRRQMVSQNQDSAPEWNYSVGETRPKNNSINNRFTLVRGLDEDPVDCRSGVRVDTNTGVSSRCGIGLDSTSTFSEFSTTAEFAKLSGGGLSGSSAQDLSNDARLRGLVGEGRHELIALERAAASVSGQITLWRDRWDYADEDNARQGMSLVTWA